MSLLNTSAAEAVARALDSAPNARIDPKIWNELGRLHRGLGEMASLVDVVNSPGTSNYSGVPVNMQLQEMTVVTARAGEAIAQYAPVRFELSGGELKAFDSRSAVIGTNKCNNYSGTNVYTFHRSDAVSPAAVAAGAMGEFILKGIAFARVRNPSNGQLLAALTTYGSRIYAAGGGFFDSRNTSSDLFGPPRDRGALHHPTSGVFLYAYQIRQYDSTCLIYFNPDRSWVARSATFGCK